MLARELFSSIPEISWKRLENDAENILINFLGCLASRLMKLFYVARNFWIFNIFVKVWTAKQQQNFIF